jgi:histone deacetylase 6
LQDCKDKIAGIVSFVSGSLRPIRSETDQYLSHWYKKNSLIYVSSSHACWLDEEYTRKIRKQRFGNVVKSPDGTLVAMMGRHFEETTEWISECIGEDDEDDDDDDEPEDNPDKQSQTVGGGDGNGERAGVMGINAILE